MANKPNKHRVVRRLGDWVRHEDARGRGYWERDDVTTGVYNINWRFPRRRGEPDRAIATVTDLPGLEGWRVELTYELVDGAIRLEHARELRERDDADPTPIYHALGGRELEQQVAAEFRQDMIQLMLPLEWRASALKTRRSGRHPVTDLELAELAESYLAACDDAPRAPMPLLVERDGRSLHALQGLKRKAVERGLLRLEGHGKVGGELTERARALLNARDELEG